jgi:hypothetical protein
VRHGKEKTQTERNFVRHVKERTQTEDVRE